ncbi:MAG: nucleotidyltransferase [Acidobacteria bacterium]|nr:nucleotidyltransferase [Acidobacteriota bacterium]
MPQERRLDLSPQFAAAAEALSVLAGAGRPACVIGGLAVQRWGEPRFTQDADLSVLAPLGSERVLVDHLLERFEPRDRDARRLALDHRVLLVRASNGVSLDIALAAAPFEEEVLARASSWREVEGVRLVTCSAEDLIIYKLVAGRPGDIQDVIGIVARQGRTLDAARVRQWAAELADLKEDPDLLRPFEMARTKAGLAD